MSHSSRPPIPLAILGFLNKTSLQKGESQEEYNEFLGSVVEAIRPEDIIDWTWTLRLADRTWYLFRLVKLRAALVDGRYKTALHGVILRSKLPISTKNSYSPAEYERKDREAEAEVEQWMADPSQFLKHQIDPDLVPARALVQHSESVEKIDRMIEREERRCDVIIQQLDSRRAVFGTRAREAVTRIVSRVLQVDSVPELVEGARSSQSPAPSDDTTEQPVPKNDDWEKSSSTDEALGKPSTAPETGSPT